MKAAFALSEFPNTRKKYFNQIKEWVRLAETNQKSLLPISQAYLAIVFHRLGIKRLANDFLEKALAGGQTDPLGGMFWAPEKSSWIWYRDTIDKHAIFLRATSLIKPKDPRQRAMLQWLLVNRRGTHWKSPKATAMAIAAIAGSTTSQGMFNESLDFAYKLGSQKKVVKLNATDKISPIIIVKQDKDVTAEVATATVEKRGTGMSFASFSWIYSDKNPKPSASQDSLLSIDRKYFKKIATTAGWTLEPLKSGDTLSVGDLLEVQLKVSAKSAFDYVRVQDPKIAGAESEILTSGWFWQGVPRYEEHRDGVTNFYFASLPQGDMTLSYTLRMVTVGDFQTGPATIIPINSPDVSAFSSSFALDISR
jgi:uncharacterized protein YfaS (alpha-2-macroglobulin family)